jgi:Xaa-Pro aminopeptidase
VPVDGLGMSRAATGLGIDSLDIANTGIANTGIDSLSIDTQTPEHRSAGRREPSDDVREAVSGGGQPVDRARMRRERTSKLHEQMARHGAGALVLLGTASVRYATGAWIPSVDSGVASAMRTVALIVDGDPEPHLFTPYPEGAPDELDPDHVHPPCAPDDPVGARQMAERMAELLPSGVTRLGVDELTGPMFGCPGLFASFGAGGAGGAGAAGKKAGKGSSDGGLEIIDAAPILGAARLTKTPDEIECIRRAQRINELAIEDVELLARPGVRQSELTARFFKRLLELGGDGWALDPIWQVVPDQNADADGVGRVPATAHGGPGFPLTSSDRILRDGDVVWVDTAVCYSGYVSDFGRTWPIGLDMRPSRAQRSAFSKWRDIVAAVLAEIRPGATGDELVAAATRAGGGSRPWPAHLYLSHGIGLDSVEAPLLGTDLGPSADEAVTLTPGMVIVLEPEVFDPATGGYRAEEVVAVTDDGYRMLTTHHWWPFD